jgi:hypothetical protein
MKIWEPKPPGTLWATPGLLWDSFTFTRLKIRIIEYNILCALDGASMIFRNFSSLKNKILQISKQPNIYDTFSLLLQL